MTYLYALLAALMAIGAFLWGFDISRRITAWTVSTLQKQLEQERERTREERARSDTATLMAEMVKALNHQTETLGKLDLSVTRLVAATFNDRIAVRDKQVGEAGTKSPLDFPGQKQDVKKMYDEGFVDVEGKKIPEGAPQATVRALGKPT